MRVNDSVKLCVAPDSPARHRLGGAEAAVIVVVIVVAAVLAQNGMAAKHVLILLSTSGVVSVVLARMATGAVGHGLRYLARVQSASAAQ